MLEPNQIIFRPLQNADLSILYNITPNANDNFRSFQKSDNAQLRTTISKTLIELFEEYRTSIEHDSRDNARIFTVNYNFKRQREKRSPPEIHMKKQNQSKLRPCNDMNGILGKFRIKHSKNWAFYYSFIFDYYKSLFVVRFMSGCLIINLN